MSLQLVVAVADNGVIGADGAMPWHVTEDMKHFKAVTSGHVVVAGRRTHESMVARVGRSLPGRHTVVVSRTTAPGGPAGWEPGATTTRPDLDSALSTAAELAAGAPEPDVVVVGGATVYLQVLPHVDTVHLTRVHLSPAGDTRMPEGWLDGFTVADSRDLATASGTDVTFQTLTRG